MQLNAFLPAVALYALVMSYTPGPNNTMLMSSGLLFGLRPTWPHIWGVTLGYPAMLALLGCGLGGFILQYPLLQSLLRYGGTAYMLYFAWQIAKADPDISKGAQRRAKPMRFYQAVLYQWLNPKGWIIALAALGAYLPLDGGWIVSLALMCAVFLPIIFSSSVVWAAAGAGIAYLVKNPQYIRWINYGLAFLLVLSIITIWLDTGVAPPGGIQ